jgi:hypothetical protein
MSVIPNKVQVELQSNQFFKKTQRPACPWNGLRSNGKFQPKDLPKTQIFNMRGIIVETSDVPPSYFLRQR